MEAMPEKKSRMWLQMSGAAISVAALLVVLRRVEGGELAAAFRNLHRGWFLAAVALYGITFLPWTWRWHLMLRLANCAVHPGATARVALIGHFFYRILPAALRGDAARSALYARWYRWPLPEILSATALDRLLGFGGLILFATAAFGLGALNGAFTTSATFVLPWLVGSAAAILAFATWVLTRRFLRTGDLVWTRWLRACAQHDCRRLISSPRVTAQGLLCGLLAQVMVSGVLALNLQAVATAPLPWGHLLWTLPVISVIGALPVTIAGLGLREGAALVLLGLYGVTAADAVAASLLTFSASLFWAAVGGVLLWREDNLQSLKRARPQTVSVVIPVLNEAGWLGDAIRRARSVPEVCEIIVVDGGSRDQTLEVAAQLGCRVCTSAPGRGGQMRLGAGQAVGDVVMLLHADTWLPPHAGRAAINSFRDAQVVGGGFWKVFRDANPLLLGSRFKCAIRLYVGQRLAGDQALFVRREVLAAAGGVPDMALMEEFELCSRLRKVGRLALADATIATSARRFERRGVLRTYLRMWRVGTQYRLGTSPQELRRIYEKE